MNTQNIETVVNKGYHGWTAKSSIVMKEELNKDDQMMVLEIYTSKGYNGGVSTIASVKWVKAENGYDVSTFVMFQDYHKNVTPVAPVKRVTSKVIESLHNTALELADVVLADAKSFYKMN